MKHYLGPVFVLAAVAVLASAFVQAQTTEKMVIALKTDDFELTETDISTLAIGEAQTIETESGRIIDVLRTADGAEVYVDGELLEMNLDDHDLHQEHVIKRHVEIECDSGEDCEENIIILTGDEDGASKLVTADGEHVFIHREVEITCSDDDEGTDCDEEMIWLSDDEHIDLEKIHEEHGNDEEHKVIVIKKVQISED